MCSTPLIRINHNRLVNCLLVIIIQLCLQFPIYSQQIADFTSIEPHVQDSYFHLPETHTFQYIIEEGDLLTEGGRLPGKPDFTGFVPENGNSSNKGFLSINSELSPGGITILEVAYDFVRGWEVLKSEAVNFNNVQGTANNCSGTVTPWSTIISCEEVVSADNNGDGYNDMGWAIEIDPVTKSVVDQNGGLTGGDKLWALGNFQHENVVIHPNLRTVYQGRDHANGYLFKFVADVEKTLSQGALYVYKGSKSGSGEWLRVNNSTPAEQNSTIEQCVNLDATIFSGIEDVEISPIDGKIYVAVKAENKVFRFTDSDPISGTTVTNFETYVGDQNYEIDYGSGSISTPWGTGNDNLAFDNQGNLWVFQDGSDNYIWLVKKEHTIQNSSVELFGIAPFGAEPTGITFSPDNRFMFMSIQHPHAGNNSTNQLDAFGNLKPFDKSVTIVVARKEDLGSEVTSTSKNFRNEIILFPNPATRGQNLVIENDQIKNITLINTIGVEITVEHLRKNKATSITLPTQLNYGIYYLEIEFFNGNFATEKIILRK